MEVRKDVQQVASLASPAAGTGTDGMIWLVSVSTVTTAGYARDDAGEGCWKQYACRLSLCPRYVRLSPSVVRSGLKYRKRVCLLLLPASSLFSPNGQIAESTSLQQQQCSQRNRLS